MYVIKYCFDLSDQGNIFSIVTHVTDLKNIHMTTPPSSHDGHAFSNKLLAVEYLAQHYGLNQLGKNWILLIIPIYAKVLNYIKFLLYKALYLFIMIKIH
jgi:hypothetical protein